MADIVGYLVDKSGNRLRINDNIYSTDETVVGTWIDGKPLYRKAVYWTTTPGGYEWVNFYLSDKGIVNIDHIHITDASFLMHDGRYIKSLYSNWVLNNIYIDTNTWQVYVSKPDYEANYTFVFEYTKK